MIVTTCFKNLSKTSCMELILTNKHNFFSIVLFSSLISLDFHLLTVTKFKVYFQKQKRKITYRKHKTLDNDKFRSNVIKHNFDKSDFDS